MQSAASSSAHILMGRADDRPATDSLIQKTEVPDGVQQVIDGLNEQVALIDEDGIILAVNAKWRREVEKQAHYGLRISRDYDAFIASLAESGDRGAGIILDAFRAIRTGHRHHFSYLYHGVGSFDGNDFKVVLTAMTLDERRHVLVSVHDVTELAKLKRQRRRLGSQLLHAQEAERRRMARDLHDSTGQSLVALQLRLINLPPDELGPRARETVEECKEALVDIQKEIRALSYLLHPPLLEDVGLEAALRSLVGGYSKRIGLEVEIETAGVGASSETVEAAIYRVVQEAIANVHRHAGATRAKVSLMGRKKHLHLSVEDNGLGFQTIPTGQNIALGVGISGMIERVRELGGRFSIERASIGSKLNIVLPRREGRELIMQHGELA